MIYTAIVFLAVGVSHGEVRSSVPTGDLFLIGRHDLTTLEDAEVLHDYGNTCLIHLTAPLPNPPLPTLRRLPNADRVSFRWWSAQIPATPILPPTGEQTITILALIGPPDASWRQQLESTGLSVLAPAHPSALVVLGDRQAFAEALDLTTSQGLPVIRSLMPLPAEARLSRDLARRSTALLSPTDLRLRSFSGPEALLDLLPTARRSGSTVIARLDGLELEHLLIDHPQLAYVEPVRRIVLHNNLAAASEAMAASEIWHNLGFNGRGIVVNHNDTGVDLDHPDLPPESIVATIGRMAYLDNNHGSHTAGSVAGRGTTASPFNSDACGDLHEPLDAVRGLAWGSQLAVNNILDDGLDQVSAMMAWGQRQGASISTNSWGLAGQISLATTYGAASVEADRAVRDADPQAPGDQALTVLFAAGNTGPGPRTVTEPATAKNVLTIGATQNLRCGSYVPAREAGPEPDRVLDLSARGPSQGRIKPDLVAPGSDVLSVESSDPDATTPWDLPWTGDRYSLNTGTSMACGLAAGATAVFHEWHFRITGSLPSPALTRAALVNGARDLGLETTIQGWGALDLEQAVQGPQNGTVVLFDQTNSAVLTTGNSFTRELEVLSADAPLRITLAWTDVPGEEDADHPLVNDLDLVVTSPDGHTYRGNQMSSGWSVADPGPTADIANNLEIMRVELPATGTWEISVTATQVLDLAPGALGQDFALATSGDVLACFAPAAPSSVSAEASGDNTIAISWSAVSGASTYSVLRAAAAEGPPYLPLAEVDGSVTTFLDTDVSGGIAYTYVVRATVDGCWSESSATASASSTGLCRVAPEFGGLESVSNLESATCSAELQWLPANSPCGALTTYSIHRGAGTTVTAGPDTLIAEGETSSDFTDYGLDPDETVAYLVRAVNSETGAEDDNRVTRIVIPTGADAITFEDDSEDGDQRWLTGPASTADSGATEWSLTTDDAFSQSHAWHVADPAAISDRALTLAQPILIPEQPEIRLEAWHRYRLHSGRDGGRLEYSDDGGLTWHDIRSGNGFTVPADEARISVGGYNNTLAGGGNDNPMAGADVWSGASRGWQALVVNLSAFSGQRLLFRFRLGLDSSTINLDGGWWIDDIRIVVPGSCQSCIGPEPPSELTAAVMSDGITLAWSPTVGADRTRVERAEGDGPFAAVSIVEDISTYVDAAVSGGTRYRYRVATSDQCWSDPSSEASATATGPCINPPWFWGLDQVTDMAAATCGIDLEWRRARPRCPGPQAAYRVYRSPGPTFNNDQALLVTETTELHFTDPSVSDRAEVSYLVRAVDRRSWLEDGNQRSRSETPHGPTSVLFDDDLEQGPDAWVTTTGSGADSGTEPWLLVDDNSHSAGHAWFVSNDTRPKDQVLELRTAVAVPADTEPVLDLWHHFDLEPFWDGGRLEYSVDGGTSWHDILDGDGAAIASNPDRFIEGRYSATLLIGGATNPLAGQLAWTGDLGGWNPVRVDLTDFAGHPLSLRLRLGCDDSRGRTGWWVDDIRIIETLSCETIGPRRSGGRVP